MVIKFIFQCFDNAIRGRKPRISHIQLHVAKYLSLCIFHSFVLDIIQFYFKNVLGSKFYLRYFNCVILIQINIFVYFCLFMSAIYSTPCVKFLKKYSIQTICRNKYSLPSHHCSCRGPGVCLPPQPCPCRGWKHTQLSSRRKRSWSWRWQISCIPCQRWGFLPLGCLEWEIDLNNN